MAPARFGPEKLRKNDQGAAVKLVLAICLAAAAASAQPLSFGVKLGHPLADAFSSRIAGPLQYTPDSGRYVIGGTAELHLPMRVSAELDVLYRPIKYTTAGLTPSQPGRAETTAGQWQFPLMLKYRLRPGFVSPFAAGGVSFERLSGVPSQTPELVKGSATGFVLGAGLEGRVPVFRISGEIRYTRWGSATFRTQTGADLSNPNQVELLVGVIF